MCRVVKYYNVLHWVCDIIILGCAWCMKILHWRKQFVRQYYTDVRRVCDIITLACVGCGYNITLMLY